MSSLMLLWFIIFLVMTFIGVPIAICVGLSTVIILIISGIPIETAAGAMYSGLNSFMLAAIPFFIFMGTVMAKGDMAKRLFAFAESLVGWLPAGLGAVNIISSLFFGGISGSSTADAAGLGQVEMEGMKQHGYDIGYAAAITVASSTLAILIPPSIIMVIYAVSANQSVARALLAGVGPGLLVALMLLIGNHIVGSKRWGAYNKFDLQYAIKCFKEAFLALLTPVIVLGGIISGIFTITEASVLGSIYVLAISMFIYRSISVRDLFEVIVETCRITGVTLFLISSASMAVYLFVTQNVPEMIGGIIQSISSVPAVVILLLDLFVLFLGMFIDATPALIMLVPIVVPIFESIGVDLIHAGTILISALAIGLITPPVGICLFAISRVAKLPMEDVVRWLGPFYVLLILAVIIISLFPPLSLWLPNIIMG